MEVSTKGFGDVKGIFSLAQRRSHRGTMQITAESQITTEDNKF
jgi:hypothetical protein